MSGIKPDDRRYSICLDSFGRLAIWMTLVITFAQPLSAQSRDRVSLEVTVGPSTGAGGKHNYYRSFSGAAEITLGVRPTGTARIVALTAGLPLPGGNLMLCAVQPGSGSQCRPDFPAIAHVGLIGGVEKLSSIGTFRIAAGPAFFGGGGPSGLGGQAQLDVAAGFSHLAFVVAARGSLFSRFNGEALRLGSLGFGLRLR